MKDRPSEETSGVIARFTILGDPKPFALQRGRVNRYGKRPIFDSKRNELKKDLVRTTAISITGLPEKPTEAPLELRCKIYRPIPKSFSKKKAERARRGEIRPTSRPDISNIIKLVEDALNGVLYRDDSQIVHIAVAKYYSDNPRLVVEIREASNEHVTRKVEQ